MTPDQQFVISVWAIFTTVLSFVAILVLHRQHNRTIQSLEEVDSLTATCERIAEQRDAVHRELFDLRAALVPSDLSLVAGGFEVPIFRPVAQIKAPFAMVIDRYQVIDTDTGEVRDDKACEPVSLCGGDTLNLTFPTKLVNDELPV